MIKICGINTTGGKRMKIITNKQWEEYQFLIRHGEERIKEHCHQLFIEHNSYIQSIDSFFSDQLCTRDIDHKNEIKEYEKKIKEHKL